MDNVKFIRRISAMVPALVACVFFSACSHPAPDNHTVAFAPMLSDAHSDDELEALLPDSAFDQDEVPRGYVIGLMRHCTNANIYHEMNFPSMPKDKIDPFCTCMTDKRVHRFTMVELVEAQKAKWKEKKVPALVHKNNVIIAQCAQSVLQ